MGCRLLRTEGVDFTWDDGRGVLPDIVTTKLGTATSNHEGVPRLVLHGFRHTDATALLRDRAPVHTVTKRLGHRDPA